MTPKILEDAQIAVAVFLGRLDDGAFAKVVPGNDLDQGRGIGHRSTEGFAQDFAVVVAQVAPVVTNAGGLGDVMGAREGAAGIKPPRSGFLIERSEILA